MIKKVVLCITAVVFGAGLLMAHGDPILGTITDLAKDQVTIKDKDNKDVKVMVDAKTKYMMGKKAAKMTDLKVGEKVSIDAEMDTKMKMYVAESVTVPAPVVDKATTTAKPAAPKPATAAAPKTPASK